MRNGRFLDPGQMDRGAVVILRPGYRTLYHVPPVGHAVVAAGDSPIYEWVHHPPAGWERAVYRSDRSLVVYRIGSGGRA